MGSKLFGVDIAKIIAKQMGPGLLPLKLRRRTQGTRDETDPTAAIPMATKDFGCRGIISDFTSKEIDGTTVQRGDKKVLILGDTLPRGIVPQSNDYVVAENVIGVITGILKRDPAAATYTLVVRG